MEFKPRYQQPFALETAIQLSIPGITQEIARLQISLQHLGDTQRLLKEHLDETPDKDADLLLAFKENQETIGSQEERIRMLRYALERKGASLASNPHYDLPKVGTDADVASTMDVDETADGGVFL